MTRNSRLRWVASLSLGLVLGVMETTSAAERRVGQGETYATIAAALAAANADDTILVTTNILTEANITIGKNITIAGLGMTNTIVQAATTRSNLVGGVTAGRIFTATASGLNITIRDMTLRHGFTNSAGGAVYVRAGGAWNVQVLNCLLTDNDATSGGGGAIWAGGDSTFTLVASNCHFRANVSSATGGAIYYERYGSTAPVQTIQIDSCTFVSNWAGSSGGAVGNYLTGSTSPVTVRNTTLVGNRANNGNGGAFSIYSGSNWFYNVTIFTNSASGNGGGLRVDPGYVLLDSTIVYGNSPGAIWKQNGTVIATNSLLQGALQNVNSTVGCILNQDPKLLLLANNGGATPTCALQSDSPCIGKGANPAGLSYDQRGPGYPRGWYAPDMGAFEWIPSGRELAYATNIFREWFANNGTINNDTPMRIALANDTFLGTNGQDFVASGWVTPGNIPAGLTAVVRRADANNVLVTLIGTAAAHTSADNVNILTLVFADAAFAGGDAASVTRSTKSDLQVSYIDAAVTPVLTYTGAGYWEVAANDGSVSNLPIVVTLASEHFAGTNGQNLAASGWVTASGLPAGLTLAATKISDFQVNLTLTGAASLPHSAANNVETLAFQFLDSAFFSQPASAVTDATKGGFFVRFLNPTLTYAATTFTESFLNDGSLPNTLALSLAGDNLTGDINENFVAAGKVVAANVPPGLTAVITRTGPTALTAALTGNAAAHNFADSIANLSFTFQDSAFSNTVANVVTNYLKANLAVNFITNAISYYVSTTGSDANNGLTWPTALATITNAHAKCRTAASDVIHLGPGIFTQPNNVISKSIVIRGSGMTDTILQASATRRVIPTPGRLFTITTAGLTMSIRDMTLRHGCTNAAGGAIRLETSSDTLYTTFLVANCLLASNDTTAASTGGGAIYASDNNKYRQSQTFSNCVFTGNNGWGEGGAVLLNSGSLNLYGCTFLGNVATNAGGALKNQGAVVMRNCTLWGNSTLGGGGAWYANAGNNYAYNSTVVSNYSATGPGGIQKNNGGGSMTIYNSILGTNSVGAGATVMSGAGNLTVSNCVIFGTYANSTLQNCTTGQDPLVSPPADNGGPTLTCAIASGSPCVNAAANALALPFDQRGYARDATPDIGAFEYGAHDSLARGTVLILY